MKDEPVACDVCGRTMLKGERTEPYLTPSRERRLVCALCAPRAQQEGWIRESADPATPTRPRRSSEGRRGLFRRRRGAGPDEPTGPGQAVAGGSRQRPGPPHGAGGPERRSGVEDQGGDVSPQSRAHARRDRRHVRAVPTNAQLKFERAIKVFNGSEHPRTVTGIARALGAPRVSVAASPSAAAEVLLTVAWDLSWYQFAVDLSDTGDAVQMRGRGSELDELPVEVREWNAHIRPDGDIALGEAGGSNGEDQDEVL